MLLLELTTDKLSLISSTAATLDVHVSFSVNTAGVITFSKQNTAIASATTTDILAVPVSTTVRNANYINVRNKDATLACDVTIQFNANATLYELFKATLQPGQMLTFTEGIGWFQYTTTPRLNLTKYVTANSVHATAATFADVTGLQFPVVSGHTYVLNAHLLHFGNAATTGAQFAIGGVAVTTLELGSISTLVNAITAPTLSAGMATAINTAIIAQADSSTTRVPTWIFGFVQPSASGTLSLRATSEVTVAAGLTIVKGSWMSLRETDN